MTLVDQNIRPDDRLRMEGKVVLVTGAGTGIGRAAALAFGKAGAFVVLAGRRAEKLEEAAAEIGRIGGNALEHPTDVSSEAEVKALVEATTVRFGRLDAAFNNAGVTAFSPIERLTAADFDRVMATNVRGVWLLLKYQIEAMRRQGGGGSIVNTSSVAAMGGTAGLSVYGASKGALDAMVRSVALEVGADGIRVNNVSPGVIGTEMTNALPDHMQAQIASHTALKRLGTPEEIADVAVWLTTDEARYVTGQSLLVDGGLNIAGVRLA